MTMHYRPCGDTSNAATVAVTKREVLLLMWKNILFLLLLVAILVVSSHLRRRHLTYCHVCSGDMSSIGAMVKCRSPKFIWAPCAHCTAVLIGWEPETLPSPRIWAHIRGHYWSAKTSLCNPLIGANLGAGQSFQIIPFLTLRPIKVAQCRNELLVAHVMWKRTPLFLALHAEISFLRFKARE
jgi:hypothetical protein